MIPDYFIDNVVKGVESKVKELSKSRQNLYPNISPWLVRAILEIALGIVMKNEGE
jgi:hypothetical protein